MQKVLFDYIICWINENGVGEKQAGAKEQIEDYYDSGLLVDVLRDEGVLEGLGAEGHVD